MDCRSSHPDVLAPVPVSDEETGEDYEFRKEPPFVDASDVRVAMFTRHIGHYLAEMLKKEGEVLNEHDADLYVVGTVAWATDEEVMTALARTTHGTCLVVNKERWLREWTFRALKPIPLSLLFLSQNILPPSYSTDWTRAAWCAGAINVENNMQFPRMHRKDLVFCSRKRPRGDALSHPLEPYAVWSGSYNLTRTARRSVETASLMWSNALATHAYRQFLDVLAHSEPLDSQATASSPALVAGP